MRPLTTSISIFLVGIFGTLFAAYSQTAVVVTGRVIDEYGKPLAGAQVTFKPDGPSDMNYSARANSEGNFRLIVAGSSPVLGSILITSEIDRDAWLVPLSPGMNLNSEYLLRPPISFTSTSAPDLGDVHVSTYFTQIRITVPPILSKDVFQSGDAISYRIKDARDRVASDGKGGRGFDAVARTITMALPIGEWTIEIKTAKLKWTTIARHLHVDGSRLVQLTFPYPRRQ